MENRHAINGISLYNYSNLLVDIPIDSMVIFHSYVDVYQRVCVTNGYRNRTNKWELTNGKMMKSMGNDTWG